MIIQFPNLSSQSYRQNTMPCITNLTDSKHTMAEKKYLFVYLWMGESWNHLYWGLRCSYCIPHPNTDSKITEALVEWLLPSFQGGGGGGGDSCSPSTSARHTITTWTHATLVMRYCPNSQSLSLVNGNQHYFCKGVIPLAHRNLLFWHKLSFLHWNGSNLVCNTKMGQDN